MIGQEHDAKKMRQSEDKKPLHQTMANYPISVKLLPKEPQLGSELARN